MLADVDPETGKPVSMNLMTDAREASLKTQALSAIMGHEQVRTPPSREQIEKIVEFESQVYVAQAAHIFGGPLAVAGGPPALGVAALRDHPAGVAGDTHDPVFGLFSSWKGPDYIRASVARGADIFNVSPVLAARCGAHQ
jgi:cytochrome c peroxidase